MRQVADVRLSSDRSAAVYYAWQCEPGDTYLSMRIEAVTEQADAGLSRDDQVMLLDAVRDAIISR